MHSDNPMKKSSMVLFYFLTFNWNKSHSTDSSRALGSFFSSTQNLNDLLKITRLFRTEAD